MSRTEERLLSAYALIFLPPSLTFFHPSQVFNAALRLWNHGRNLHNNTRDRHETSVTRQRVTSCRWRPVIFALIGCLCNIMKESERVFLNHARRPPFEMRFPSFRGRWSGVPGTLWTISDFRNTRWALINFLPVESCARVNDVTLQVFCTSAQKQPRCLKWGRKHFYILYLQKPKISASQGSNYHNT